MSQQKSWRSGGLASRSVKGHNEVVGRRLVEKEGRNGICSGVLEQGHG